MSAVSPALPPVHSLRLDPGPHGHRYTIDAFLLADFAFLSGEHRVADLGAGSGAVSILMAQQNPALRVIGFDLQEDLVRLAAANAKASGLTGRVAFVRADLRQAGNWMKAGRFDAAVINPPYRKVGSGRLSPDPGRAMARHEVSLDVSAWLDAARHLLVPEGRLFVTHLAEREGEILFRMEQAGFVLQRLRRVHPLRGKPPTNILIEAKRTQGSTRHEAFAPEHDRREYPPVGDRSKILPPLFVYQERGLYTGEIRRMYGRFGIDQP